MQFALFHSPLVGPTTRRWVAGSLVTAGHNVAEMLVPDVDRRVELEADMPEIRLAFFEAPFGRSDRGTDEKWRRRRSDYGPPGACDRTEGEHR